MKKKTIQWQMKKKQKSKLQEYIVELFDFIHILSFLNSIVADLQ